MSSRTNPLVLQIINIVSIFGTIVFNSLANILPLNGVNTGQVADSYPNLFTPPGYVFAIWGVIYILLATFAIYQVRPSERGKEYLQDISFLYLVGAIFNISWLIVFHYSFGNPTLFVLSELPIVLLLVTLLFTYVRLGIGETEVPLGVKLAVHLPVSVYVGWISLATIASTASVLNVLIPGIPQMIQELWTVAVIIIALVITLSMIFLRHDFAYGLVVIWASVGIAIKQAAIALISYTAIATAVLVLIAILAIPIIKKESIIDYYLMRTSQ
ncbi:tryptophan-rich sensory protein [Candidatus Thorarchaeota archaeon]|nr:MAG: tryptophan-rich sensory protein [Candidatus Thorarchaeota archaeon]